ncbi:MAG: futalosine hydrolase [Saprospiraceae bacterium]
MKILLVAATEFEILPFLDKSIWPNLHILITGVGQMQTAFHTGLALQKETFDLAINAGICGSFRKDWELGKVVHIISESFGDLGIEEADGSFKDMFEMGFLERNNRPFQDAKLTNENAAGFVFLERAHGLTVNKVHGFQPSIDKIRKTYPADIENMEGAGFFYACKLLDVRFLEIRSISNYVEKRNRENWEIGLALENLHKVLAEILAVLH